MNIILYSDDVALLTYWEKCLGNNCDIKDDLDSLLDIKDSIIVLNYSACSDCKNVLNKANENNNRVLVLHRVPNLNSAKAILGMGAKGYGNALMREHFLISAIETIKDGMVWLYPEYTTMLIQEIPKTDKNIDNTTLDLLTQREKEVALLLKDGKQYKDISQELDITPRTVKAHAQSIYSKLNIKDKLGLALLFK